MRTRGAGERRLLVDRRPRAAAAACCRSCSTRTSSSRRTASGRCRGVTRSTRTFCTSTAPTTASTTSRRIDRPACSAATRTGAGPIWFPVNYLLDRIAAEVPPLLRRRVQGRVPDRLRHVHDAAGGRDRALAAADAHLPAGRRRTPARRRRRSSASRAIRTGATYVLFYEYFHGDNGAGLGASHQTGWTGLVAKLLQQSGPKAARRRKGANVAVGTGASQVRRPAASNAPIQAAHRVRRHALQRLADPEERADGAGRDRSRGRDGDGPTGVRAVRIGPDRRRRARARPGRAPRRLHDARAGAAPPEDQRRAARGHPHPSIDKAPHRFHARHDARSRELPLSNLTAANGVRQAVRVVDPRAARRVAPCGARRPLRRA